MKRIKETDRAIGGINIVPIIDVCLVLLVILFIMTPVINFDNLPVNLPEAMTKETKDKNVTVSFSSDGKISIDAERVTMDGIPQRLGSLLKGHDDIVVVVRADKDLPYGTVENLIKVVNRYAGRNAVAIATKQREHNLEATSK